MQFELLMCCVSSTVLLFMAGCARTTDEPFSCDTEVRIEITDCNEFVKHPTVPIAVIPFTDVREDENKDEDEDEYKPLFYQKNSEVQECIVQDFNQAVTYAFEAALQCSGATMTDANNASLYLTGKIRRFGAWVYVNKRDYTWLPLEVALELKDANDTVLWTKTAGDKTVKLLPFGKNQSFRSNVDIDRFIGYVILYRRGEDWTMSDSVRDFTLKCISSALDDLVTDEPFWNSVKP